ncbi:hypothetical protein KP509_21G043000 [Ceratopteris richardii]|uniref:Uncharacterized protein n=1 Tax=Ceratopteris richardii TaxID=49495 RepID=A0A8T2SBE5_CERRI|nr:hypothetical protein KP509_21G043000 [Ceratopteris richardii]
MLKVLTPMLLCKCITLLCNANGDLSPFIWNEQVQLYVGLYTSTCSSACA